MALPKAPALKAGVGDSPLRALTVVAHLIDGSLLYAMTDVALLRALTGQQPNQQSSSGAGSSSSGSAAGSSSEQQSSSAGGSSMAILIPPGQPLVVWGGPYQSGSVVARKASGPAALTISDAG